MSQDIFQKALAILELRELTLMESVNRIFLMLPSNGRVNVTVKRLDGEIDTATLTVSKAGEVICRLSGEPPDNVIPFGEWG